jgi:hypothetical protein
MTDASLIVPVWIIGALAFLMIPGLIWVYRHVLVNRRIDDLESSIWSKQSVDAYADLFTKEEPFGSSADRDLSSLVRREFLAVHSAANYTVALIPLLIAVGVVVWVCCSWTLAKLDVLPSAVETLEPAVIFALIGAYVWSVYELLGRFRSRDLTPDDLVEMTLRHIAAVPIGHAFSLLVMEEVGAAAAFASAAFPLRDIRLLIRQRALKKISQDPKEDRRSTEGHVATMIDGLSDQAIARLEELHIVTYMDLAYINPVRLMARTGFSLRHILAWVDQALLAVYAPQLKTKLTKVGIPCALDAREFYETHCMDMATGKAKPWRTDETVKALAAELGISIEFIPEILVRVHEDPHVQFLASIWYPEATPAAHPQAELLRNQCVQSASMGQT